MKRNHDHNTPQVTVAGGVYAAGSTYAYQKKRSRSDWAGIGMSDAFKNNLDFFIRQPARRMFYQNVSKTQKALARLFGKTDGNSRIKPDLSPFYSTYPAALAPYAAIGLTVFLEYLTFVDKSFLEGIEKDTVLHHVHHEVHPGMLKYVAGQVVDCVRKRLFIEDLGRYPAFSCVEIYRLFSASQQNLKFATVGEIVFCAVFFGDVLPDIDSMTMHPITFSMLKMLLDTCQPFLQKLPETKSSDFMALGMNWVRLLIDSIARFLPPPNNSDSPETDNREVMSNTLSKSGIRDDFEPLNTPTPPVLTIPLSTPDVLRHILGTKSDDDPFSNTLSSDLRYKDNEPEYHLLNEFGKTLFRATNNQQEWEDIRSDIMEKTLRMTPFESSPVQGSPTDGSLIHVDIGNGHSEMGEIFDRPVELSDDNEAFNVLLKESAGIANAMKQLLYPNRETMPEPQRFHTNGALDSSRLAIAGFSDTVFKRYRVREHLDPRGKPVLVIACDGSASLSSRQMKMTKILAAAWLQSTVNRDIQVMACLYHSGTIRRGVGGPLVQWIHHPQKTIASNILDSIRAVATLPDDGTGAQSDALSIAFIVREAQNLAQERNIYCILVSDCCWNKSFKTDLSGTEEVSNCLNQLKEELGDKIHTTLVALGCDDTKSTGLESVIDKIIRVSDDDLKNCTGVARKIGLYVASCMKERKKLTLRK